MRLAIIGTGPGAMSVTEADLAGRTVCAVNQAANHLPRVDILAFQDPAEMILPTLRRWDYPEVWCSFYSVKGVQDLMPAALVREGAGVLASLRIGRWVETGETLPDGKPLRRFMRSGYVIPTMIMALVTAGVLGYRDVAVYGADMRGSGSPARPQQGFQDSETTDFADRWRREREQFAATVRHLWHGYRCRVRRVVRPLPLVVEALTSHHG